MTDTPQDDLGPYLGFLDDDRIELPPFPSIKYPREVGGHVYQVEQPNAEVGTRLAGLGQIMAKMAAKVEVDERDVRRLKMTDGQEMEFQRDTLGAVLDEMIADGVTYNHLKIAANYVFVVVAFSEAQAQTMLKTGALTGKAVPSEAPANRAERRGAKSKGKSKGNPAT